MNLWQKYSKDIGNLDDYGRLTERIGSYSTSYLNIVRNFIPKGEQGFEIKLLFP